MRLVFTAFLFILSSLAVVSAFAERPACESLFAAKRTTERSDTFSPLRSKGDLRFLRIVYQIRSSLKPGADGYVLIPLADVFPLAQYGAIYPKLPKGYQFEWAKTETGQEMVLVTAISVSAKKRHGITEAKDEFVHGVSLPEDFLRSVVTDAQMLRAAINEAQAGFERVEIAAVSIRTFTAGEAVAEIHDSSEFHPDGGYMTFTLAPKGSGTLRSKEKSSNPSVIHQTPASTGLLITNLERAQVSGSDPTYHASPIDHGDRMLILIRFRRVHR